LQQMTREVSDLNVSTGTFLKFGKNELFAKAPISVKAINNQTMFIFLCINVDEFTSGVLEIRIIEGKTLAYVIIFALALLVVVFITYGISSEVSAQIFRPLKMLLRRLRTMQFQNIDVDVNQQSDSEAPTHAKNKKDVVDDTSAEVEQLKKLFQELLDTRRFEINDFLMKGDSEAIMDLA